MENFIILFAAVLLASQAIAQNQKLQKCQPWRSVTGYNQLCTELGSFNCARLKCPGNSNTIVKDKLLLENPSSGYYIFSSAVIISTATQNQIISQATVWANANKPAGYTIEFIKYIPDIITSSGTVTSAGIDIKVTYKTCTGSIALPN